MIGLRDLMDEAKRLNVSVALVHFDSQERLGEYCEADREILIDLAMTMRQIKEVLAHELAHAHFGHSCTTPEAERQANRRAARLLIDLTDYVRAEAIDADPGFIADELGVTRRVVRTFQREWLPSLSLRRHA